MSRTLEASMVMPLTLLICVFFIYQMLMAVSSCWLLTLATVKLEERARSYSSIIYKSVEGPASLDLFGNGLNLERYHVNSAAVNYLALALSDDINSVKHIFKNKSEK